MVLVDNPHELPEQLLTDVAQSDDILLYIQYGDDLQCSLTDLKSCTALKLALINRGALGCAPHLEANEAIFDYAIRYDGPDFESMDFGNIKWVENEKQRSATGERDEVIIPEAHDAITTVIEKILPFVKNRERLFLSAQNEEVMIQAAILREKYGLPIGHRVPTAEFFVDKVAMTDFFTANKVPMAKTATISCAELRKMTNDELDRFLDDEESPQLPIFIKPVAGAGAYETFLANKRSELVEWIKNSEEYTYEDFLFQEKLRPPQFMAIVLHTREGVIVPGISRSMTPFSNFVQKGEIIRETHMRREDPEYQEVANFALGIFQKLLDTQVLRPEDYGCYFVDAMRTSRGKLAVMEVQARHPAGFFVTAVTEDMHGADVESFAVAWPFLKYREDKKRIRYHDACCLMYPTLGGRHVANHTPDPTWFEPGTNLAYIGHFYKPGDTIPKWPLSIVHLVCEVAIVGPDAESVTKSADTVLENFIPVTVEKIPEEEQNGHA